MLVVLIYAMFNITIAAIYNIKKCIQYGNSKFNERGKLKEK